MKSKLGLITGFILSLLIINNKMAMAQQSNHMVRLAKIDVDQAQLQNYNAALKEQMAAAMAKEPGVLTYYAMADKENPAHIIILEIYADSAAYLSHIASPHFKKYKTTVQNMVKSLQLSNVDIIGVAKKPGM